MSREQRRAIDEKLRNAPEQPEASSIDQMRAGFARLMSQYPVPTEHRETPAALAGRPAVLVEPPTTPLPGTILYFHGGSFSLGSPHTAMALTANLVLRTGIRALSLDYRLAPEHPFPAGIEDGLAAYRSLLEDNDPSSIVFAGDSAGGGLSVTTTLAARDAGLPMPAGIVAFSPGLDHTCSGASMVAKEAADPFFTREGMSKTGELYRADADPAQPLLAPAVHADLTGFPPILLQVGTNEVLLDDSVRLAERAREADVDVILDITADVPHVFQTFTDTLDEAGQALDRAALFIKQRLA
ncbi:alpha/beta hydrolase [Amycolatopsis sp. FU40]|uniref:alpha/beta hydrolase n=1 Tax=Amycolatopsis sp. FU40 TaxID=2914159 RepID=UPI001F1C9712|nr:alpha/beta hydrolase [Amycolatopsis sp. FU40]UKD55685.1 alpha/beta hydrolase [Amycolatopsis sp. FU40]